MPGYLGRDGRDRRTDDGGLKRLPRRVVVVHEILLTPLPKNFVVVR